MQVLPAILESRIILTKLRIDRQVSRALLFLQNLTVLNTFCNINKKRDQ